MNMKKYFVSACLFLTLVSQAQVKEGRIVYERVSQMPARFFSNNPELANQIPKSRTDHFELLFANNQSLYQFLPSATEEQTTFSGGGQVIQVRGGNNDVVYYNLDKGQTVAQRDFMDNEFIVADTIRKFAWKLTDETKKVLNYTVRKAITTRVNPSMRMSMENGEMKRTEVLDTVPVAAWFTTDIPVSVGPDFAGQLPGAILELDINNGQQVYKATELSPKVAVAKIKEPNKGKKVTQAEFITERNKLMDEMRNNMRGNGSFRIQQ
jgi:GLPGLI family protein